MSDVYVIGVSCTPFGKQAEKTFKDLTRDAFMGLLADTEADVAHQVQQAWFGNCGMGTFGQRNIRGQVCFTPLVREGIFPERVPLINVEGGCATASMAFHGAYKDILSASVTCHWPWVLKKHFSRVILSSPWKFFKVELISLIRKSGRRTTARQESNRANHL